MTSQVDVGGLEEFMGTSRLRGLAKPTSKGVRPVSLDLRLRPLKTTRFNHGAGTLLATDSAVWAGLDHGIWVWDVADSIRGCTGETSQYTLGEEDAAAFTVLPVHGSSTSCLVVDTANNIVWSGHRDGMVRSWSTNFNSSTDKTGMKTSMFMWEAHPGPVAAIVLSTYGELWTLSNNCSIRVWPWEALSKALSTLTGDGTSSAAGSIMSRSYFELRPRVIAACAGNLVISEFRQLVVDHCNGRIWTVGASTAVVWDARTREILNFLELSNGQEFSNPEYLVTPRENLSEEGQACYSVAASKNLGGWFQRSRNAVLGAADAMRKAAIAVQGGDPGKRVEAIVAAIDGSIWVGYGNGVILQFDSNGNRQMEHRSNSAVRCMCIVGTRLWVGFADGRILVLALETCQPVGGWVAHRSGVLQMAVSGFYVFSLATSGTIRGWNAAAPGQIDDVLRADLVSRESNYTSSQRIQVLSCTWNVGGERPSLQALQSWVALPAAAASLVVVGLQEMEAGAGSLALAAVKEVGLQEKGSSVNGQWWLDNISGVLGQGTDGFELLGSRQLAGILIGVWVRKRFARYVGDVDAAAVACGFGRALGNKGAVAVKVSVFRRMFCAVNSHFAAHAEALARRNADFEHVFSRMSFGAYAGDLAGAPALSEADFLLWLGDFNYRLENISYDHTLAIILQKDWDTLLKRDQLRTEMIAGHVFHGLREGRINFPPTYKFDKGISLRGPATFGYDSSEKRRVPAYCDRVLFQDSFDRANPSGAVSLNQPVKASVVNYEANMDVVSSDHKPVRCMLNLEFAVVDESKKRCQYGDVLRSNSQIQEFLKVCNKVPETVVGVNEVSLDDGRGCEFQISNSSPRQLVRFIIFCQGDPRNEFENGSSATFISRGGYGFPQWLQVKPASGVIPPGQSVSITLRSLSPNTITYENVDMGQQRLQVTDIKDRSAVLDISIQAALSTSTSRHRITVHQSIPGAKVSKERAQGSQGTRTFPLFENHPDIVSSSTATLGPSAFSAASKWKAAPTFSYVDQVYSSGPRVAIAPDKWPDMLSSSPGAPTGFPQPKPNLVSMSPVIPDLLSDGFAASTTLGSTEIYNMNMPSNGRAGSTTKSAVLSNLPDLIDLS